MEIIAADLASRLAVANVVESCETGSRDTLHSMVWYQKVFLPPHEDHILVSKIKVGRIIFEVATTFPLLWMLMLILTASSATMKM